MQELKPCPFCGGTPVLSERFQAAKIWCNDCEIHTNPYPGKLSAIAVWNKRPLEREISTPPGYTLVPNSALAWLFGEEGSFEKPKDAKGNFWWRSRFRKMIEQGRRG